MSAFLSKLAAIKKWHPVVLLTLFVIIAYLPLSSFLFAIKNDAFIYNYPNKHFFSEALHNGYMPYWNPYLNYGFPLFADPGFAWWHPLTWVFGLIGYNPFTFTLEVLVYILIAALGMYKLGRGFSLNRQSAFVIGGLFASSGFFIGNLQHINFLTCAAFLPWVVLYWWKLQQTPSLKHVLSAAFATYLLCTAGHPAIPIGSLYFMILLTATYFFLHRKEIKLGTFIIYNILYLAATAIMCLPVILSYAQLMPYYVRNEAVSHLTTDNLGFTPASYLSFLSPVTTIKGSEFFHTDVSMRNGYFSLFGLIALLYILFTRKNKIQKVFLVPSFALLLLSLGGWVKLTLYENLPLLNFIRTNGEFRVFALFGFIVCVGFLLHDLLANQRGHSAIKKLTGGVIVVLGVGLVLCAALLFKTSNTGNSAIQFNSGLKGLIDSITLPQSLLLGLLIGLSIAVIYYIILQKKAGRFLPYFILADVIINAWLLLPITGVGQKNVAYIAGIINQAPKGFPVPPLTVKETTKPIALEDEQRVGDWNWYNKQIVHEPIEYPSILRHTQDFYNDTLNNLRNKPFLFLKNGAGTLSVLHFSPGDTKANVILQKPDTVIFLQNSYPGWHITVNGQNRPIATEGPFLATALPRGTFQINFRFSPALW